MISHQEYKRRKSNWDELLKQSLITKKEYVIGVRELKAELSPPTKRVQWQAGGVV